MRLLTKSVIVRNQSLLTCIISVTEIYTISPSIILLFKKHLHLRQCLSCLNPSTKLNCLHEKKICAKIFLLIFIINFFYFLCISLYSLELTSQYYELQAILGSPLSSKLFHSENSIKRWVGTNKPLAEIFTVYAQ